MSETSVQPINSVSALENSAPTKVLAPERVDYSSSREHVVPDSEKSTRRAEAEKAQANPLANIAIHFNVDEETNRLIVVVTERESGRVIRTIPASEFEKLHAGDLLKLTA